MVSRVGPRYLLRFVTRFVILPEARRDHQRISLAKVSLKTAQREQEQPEALHKERHRLERELAPEDDPDLQDIDPSLPGDTEEVPRRAPESSSLAPRRIALPLPGQEVSTHVRQVEQRR